MIDTEPQRQKRPAAGGSRGGWLELGLVFAVFFLHGAWPAPDVNEAHYLAKAKHFWNPAWIPSDFFLDSADAHAVFYWTLGWLSLFLPLPAVAWVGRLLTWLLMSWGWQRLSWAVVPQRWLAPLSAALFLVLNEGCHAAGEWVVGGFEAKGIAYALVFFALEALINNRWSKALVLLGAAASFHVLVGGWTVVAAGFAWIAIGQERPPLRELLPGLGLGLLLALPGLVPAVLLTTGVEPEIAAEANRIYVFERLPHHLLPSGFPLLQTIRHALLVVALLVLARLTSRDTAGRRLTAVVLGALAISLAGLILTGVSSGAPVIKASIMRYYWFRLADVFVPLGMALSAISYVHMTRMVRREAAHFWLGAVVAIAAYDLSGYAIRRTIPELPRGDVQTKVANYGDWRRACAFVAANTPADARFLTPRSAQTFKWYAQRSEVANWKDIPQDAGAIVAWWNRLETIYRTDDPDRPWRNGLSEVEVAKLREFARQYEADYLLTDADPPLPFDLLYQNDTYAIYRLSE